MTAFATSIAIRSTSQQLWAILTDAAKYPSWNRTVTGVDGVIAPGKTITVHASISPGRAFPVTVVAFTPPTQMIWRSGMPLGLFTGERTFELHDEGDGTVTFAMREVYTGLLAPLITKSIPDLQPAFDEFAACLKSRAEAG